MRGIGVFVAVCGLSLLTYIAASAFCIALGYGVVVLIFRHAFGVELPNPFA